jgi:hypothetical protein
MRRLALVLVGTLLLASPLAAQVRRTTFGPAAQPSLSLRPFLVLSEEGFTAKDSFDAVFGKSAGFFWGGGLQVAFRNNVYIDLTVSRFEKTGQRAFIFNGQGFPLGIDLTAQLTPIEATLGRRFLLRSTPRVVPYLGAGGGWYVYKEDSDGDEFSASHAGGLVVGGVEVRASRLVRLSGDVQYTYVSGIIGAQGLAKEAGDSNLGGVAGRFRVILGR